MIRIITLIAGLAVSQFSWAHVKIGTYMGRTLEGGNCAFEVKDVSFAGNLKHPLNERVTIHIQGEELILSHPGHADAETQSIGFDHDHLNAVQGVTEGAIAASLTMEHTDGKDGPKEIWLLKDFSDDSLDSYWFCGDLSFHL